MPDQIATSKVEARQLGLKTYQGPKPCRRGHVGIRSLKGECVDCRAITGPAWVSNNRGKIAEQTKARYFANVGESRAYAVESAKRWRGADPRRTMLANAKARAKRDGREFNIELDDVVIPEVCPVLNIPMVSPSIDRVDSSGGYTKDNIQVISWRANKLKSDATLEELLQLVAYVSAHHSSGSSS